MCVCVSEGCVCVCVTVWEEVILQSSDKKKCKKFNSNFISIYKIILRPFLSKYIV